LILGKEQFYKLKKKASTKNGSINVCYTCLALGAVDATSALLASADRVASGDVPEMKTIVLRHY
jgi:hypothetical protein